MGFASGPIRSAGEEAPAKARKLHVSGEMRALEIIVKMDVSDISAANLIAAAL